MKSVLLIIGMFCAFSLKAQIVNIPDAVFKSYLINQPSINLNGDGEIQVFEANLVEDIAIFQAPDTIRDLTGIRASQNLQTLWLLGNHPLTVLDVHGLDRLKELYYGGSFTPQSTLSVLDVSGCDSLRNLSITIRSILSNLDVSGLANLEDLTLYENSGGDTLRGVNCPRLKRISSQAAFDLFDFSNSDSLESVVSQGAVNTYNLTNCRRLTEFDLYSGSSASVILRNCSALQTLSTLTAITDMLDLTGCTALTQLDIWASPPVLDLSTCINLQFLRIDGNVRYLNLKNGSELLSFDVHPDTLAICTDDFEINFLDSILSANPIAGPYSISANCSFFPGGSYNTIKGKARVDANNNGCTVSDAGINNVAIRVDDGSNVIIRFTSGQGEYRHYPYAGVFTLTPYLPYPYFNITPNSATVDFDTANSLIDSVDFCIAPSGVHNDVEITVLPLTPSRPGFDATYQLAYKNRGTTTQSGAVQFNYDNTSSTFVSSSVGTSGQSAGQLNWNYINLQPFERRTINVTLNLFPPPNNNIGDTLYYLANISPVTGDETPTDNSFVLAQLVIGSFDPNDKTCLQGAALSPADINKPLDYLIRFQNLGTDTAFNVVVMDTLSDKLDLNTLEIISTSHACDIELKNNRLQFYFRDINLPHAAINEPASHGFVAFKIRPKPNVVVGDSLNNKASIYFDFNLPVVTNTATTIVALPSGPVPVKLDYFSLSSQQDGNHLVWKISTEDAQTNFSVERGADGIHFNSINSFSATNDRCALPFNVIDDKPLTGRNYYRLKIADVDNKSFYSKTLVTGKTTSGVQVIAVTSDQTNTTVYLDASKAQKIHAKIVAADGRVVLSQAKSLTAGSNTWILQTADLAKGVYSFVLYTETEVLAKRFIK